MKKKSLSLLVLMLTLLLLLAACASDKETAKENQETTPVTFEKKSSEAEAILDLSVTNDGKPIKGGVLKVAMVKDEPFQGIFSWELYEDGYDSDLMSWTSNSIFEVDQNFMITDEGIASMKVDHENNKVTIKIRDGVRWSDGKPLKIEDLILPYEIIGHPDYRGVRFNTEFKNIIGAEEYNAGKADTISGIKKIDERTLEIHFKQLSPAISYGGDGLWTYAAPSHQIGKIPVDELIQSDAVRKNPVTLGPFKVDKIVPGESVQYVKNNYYWKGKPKLDGVLVKVVPSSSISVAIASGEYDIVQSFNATKMPEIENLDNITILGRQELFYSYLGFKVGKYDYANNTVVTKLEDSKMGNEKLRQAMGYALDIEQVSEVFFNNLRVRANSLIPPVFTEFHDDQLKGYTYDPEKAKALLDEAGYKDVNGDGLREDPKGKKLEIKLASMTSDETAEEITAYYLQNWKDVGLNVTLTTGRLIEFNSFYDKVKADDPEIDIFMGAWSTGTNPSPSGLYGKADEFNFSRYTSEELETAIKNIDSPAAFDTKYRAEQFRAFQEHLEEVATTIPMQFRYEIFPVNKRVKNYNVNYGEGTELHEIELVAEEPIAASK
ncbi:peptide/nickel transport system substrate-binding protein [Lysinibacillus composti]|uniref:Oligopeptide ABC transporter substrate-binding protein n=1 Tax=Lysinibacillus composti TaxID=720633 RepID=A0A3N9UGY3_9BACI|nr:oligopeptide ABC transporter substrate-binding protein [Lysinibacillus composti]MBM7607925.1 peptide/nickel transport system substrate-binding protein [Lysinibacillus composti]RQW75389.1 oligopeptide ABC transporter substrate-binding protein [Lysinibacillus composti]